MPWLIIAVVVLVALAVLFVSTTGRRDKSIAVGALSRETRRADRNRDSRVLAGVGAVEPGSGREIERAAVGARHAEHRPALSAAPALPGARPVPFDADAYGVTRRQFFNRGIVALFGLSLTGFGSTVLAFLWPTLGGGFGSKIKAGRFDDIMAQVRTSKEPFYVPEGRFYVNPYPPDNVGRAQASGAYSDAIVAGMRQGAVALYQKCPHLGCRVPWCKSSQWFECPCHGSKYNRVGEKKGGPAPRGMDRFAFTVEDGVLVVDTKQVFQGPPIGTNTTGQEQEGPHCT